MNKLFQQFQSRWILCVKLSHCIALVRCILEHLDSTGWQRIFVWCMKVWGIRKPRLPAKANLHDTMSCCMSTYTCMQQQNMLLAITNRNNNKTKLQLTQPSYKTWPESHPGRIGWEMSALTTALPKMSWCYIILFLCNFSSNRKCLSEHTGDFCN